MMPGRSRSPFTATQWQELEHQALIFSYMSSGMPVPPDLIGGSLEYIPSRLFPSQQMSWGCLQMGYGRKVDPEPGRCRRTDGKKWRCSKEAYPDSKYCERHMHRGKNRSRKPVEISPPTPSKSPNVTSHPLFPSSSFGQHQQHPFHDTSFKHPELRFPPQNHFNIGSINNRDSLSLNGLKEEVDEHPFFSEASGTLKGYGDSFTNMGSLAPTSNYTGLKLHDLNDISRPNQQAASHCFLDTDFTLATPIKMDGRGETRRLFDEWPSSREPWSDRQERERHERVSSFSTTQLSISTPISSADFLSSKPKAFDDV